MSYFNIREEELKNRIAQDYFANFDSNKIIGDIDFCVAPLNPIKNSDTSERESLLWAEAKKGKVDSYKSIVQLILTIGKSKLYDKNLPPAYLGAFDSEKIAFIAYNSIHDVFYTNDFNWKVRACLVFDFEKSVKFHKIVLLFSLQIIALWKRNTFLNKKNISRDQR